MCRIVLLDHKEDMAAHSLPFCWRNPIPSNRTLLKFFEDLPHGAGLCLFPETSPDFRERARCFARPTRPFTGGSCGRIGGTG
jgi:hypothetical protein